MAQVANKRLAMMLFSSDDSLYCHLVRLVLAEKGISYDSSFVDVDNTPEDLKELNPYNEVPTLVDRELALYDHRVIVEYLDERFPHPPLMPVDPVSRSRIRQLLQRIERDWIVLSTKITNGEDVDNSRKALLDSLVGTSAIFEQKPFFMSDEYTLIDCALAALLWRLPSYGITIPPHAKALINYADSLFEREAFKESLTEAEKELRP